MSYENETKEDLIDILTIKNDELNELSQEVEELKDELNDKIDEINESVSQDELFEIKSEIAEPAFMAGYAAGKNKDNSAIKSYLNYKIEARL